MNHRVFPVLENCALCGASEPLMRSHILPKFLFKLLKGSREEFFSITAPKRKEQDGTTADMLCFNCEQKFSLWEDSARKHLFSQNGVQSFPLKYEPWLYSFALSISWRVLTYLKYSTPSPYQKPPPAAMAVIEEFPQEVALVAEERLRKWGRILNGNSPAGMDQIIYFLGPTELPYKRDAVGFCACHTDLFSAVLSQMGSVCILGLIRGEDSSSFNKNRIFSLGGKITGQNMTPELHSWFLGYLNNVNSVGVEFVDRPNSAKLDGD